MRSNAFIMKMYPHFRIFCPKMWSEHWVLRFVVPSILYPKGIRPCATISFDALGDQIGRRVFEKNSLTNFRWPMTLKSRSKVNSRSTALPSLDRPGLDIVGFALGITFLSLTYLTWLDFEFNMEKPSFGGKFWDFGGKIPINLYPMYFVPQKYSSLRETTYFNVLRAQIGRRLWI